jgi:hypothetical protein
MPFLIVPTTLLLGPTVIKITKYQPPPPNNTQSSNSNKQTFLLIETAADISLNLFWKFGQI